MASLYGLEAEIPSICISKNTINIRGFLFYTIRDKHSKEVLEKGNIHNTFTSWGKEQIAKLCGGLGGYPISSLRVRKDTSWTTMSVSNSLSGGTLIVDGQGTISGPGTVNCVCCAGTLTGSTEIHNSIDCTIVLSSDMELDVDVKIWFTGLNNDGNAITAGRLGNTGGNYNSPIGSVSYELDGVAETVASTNSVNGYTLIVRNKNALTASGSYTVFGAMVNSGLKYHQFSGHTIYVGPNQELYVYQEYVFS